MDKDELVLFSEDKSETILNNQIDIYHGLQKRAHSILRLLVAVVGVTVTLFSAILTVLVRVEDGEIEGLIQFEDRILESPENVALAMATLFLLGLILAGLSTMSALFDISNVVKVITEGGVYPYLDQYSENNVGVVFTKSDSDSMAINDVGHRLVSAV